MADYTRPEGIRFRFDGVKTNSSADAMPRHKSPYAQNIRVYSQSHVQSRPQLVNVFSGGGNGGVYALEPSLGVYKAGSNLVQNGSFIDGGYTPAMGASLIPFRPNASPQAWEYVFDAAKATKVLSGTVQKVGIAEPQAPVDAYITGALPVVAGAITTMAATGVASSPVPANRFTDTVLGIFPDPASSSLVTLQVSPTNDYSRNMLLKFSGGPTLQPFDVFPAQTQYLGISGIYYFSGTTGRCVIVPAGMAMGPGTEGESIYADNFLNSIRRGALIQFGSGEKCYVLSVTTGPNGAICFETTTTGAHTTADTFTMIAGVQFTSPSSTFTIGQGISSPIIEINLSGSGIGLVTSTTSLAGGPFVGNGLSLQEQDYIHFSVAVQFLSSLNEMKILFDVGDGSFTQNFYWYAVRVSDIQAAVNNSLTALGAAQLVEQRAIIDEEQAVSARNQGNTVSGDQMTPGDGQWAEIVFPISALTRVGGDETKTLQNVNSIQYLFNVNAATNASFGDVDTFGGGQVDVGDVGSPVRYWIRPRSSLTGAMGNPSPVMRYGVSPRRQMIVVNVPTTYSDTQADTWDIFRDGGALDAPRKVGNMLIGSASTFTDNYSDDAIANNEVLLFDNLEPFPTIENPFKATTGGLTTNGAGTAIIVNFTAASLAAANALVLGLLPGNEVQIGQQTVYTLRQRPTFVTSSGSTYYYLFQFVENTGTPVGQAVLIQEPLIANQHLPYAWGPDVNGVLFAVGDSYRPGVVNRTKSQNPDSALDDVDELCPPTEPLQNGVVMRGLSFVASPIRWWAGTAGSDEGGNLKYTWNEVPVGDGLAAPYAICTDGEFIYFVARHGIVRHANGPGTSLTDDDLYNLFPHEGTNGVNVTYNGYTLYAPNYAYASGFRLGAVNDWLYFDYQDVNGQYHTLVMNTKTLAWQGNDVFSHPVSPATIHAGISEVQISPVFIGDTAASIWQEALSPVLTGETVSAVVATKEEMPDVRANQMWGDASVDILAQGGNITVTPMFFGVALGTNTTLTGNQVVRQSGLTVNLNGQKLSRSMGLMFSWNDRGATTVLYSWQPSFVPQPEDFTNRFDDWDDCGMPGAKFIQGVLIEADTAGQAKSFAIQSSDDLSINPLLEMPCTFTGQGVQAFSLATPFVAHLVRLVPQDFVVCRKWRVKYIYEPCPEQAENWVTQGTTFGFVGFIYAQRLTFAYQSQAAVYLTVTALDGPEAMVSALALPNTAGQFQKREFLLSAPLKGRLFFFRGQSSLPWRPYVDASEVWVKPWGSTGPFVNKPLIGGGRGDHAKV